MNIAASTLIAAASPEETASVGLSSLRPGVGARIVAIADHGSASRRLMALGFVPGSAVQVVRVAPLRDPIEVEVRGTRFGLRRVEADWIRVVVP